MSPFRPMPEAERRELRRACRIQAVWILLLASIVTVIYLAVGNSQAMKTAWIEDLLSFVPPVAFLVSTWIEGWAPNDRYPLGFIRVTSIGYLVSAVALAGVGLFLIVDSGMALIATERPTIGSVEVFGVTVWFGWLMIGALAYSSVLPVVFGRLKLAPAHRLHDKILLADALMNKADWMTGAAAILGVVGIGFGLWWADAAAAILISVDVLHDGFKHTGAAIRDLTDEMPRTVDDSAFEPLTRAIEARVDAAPWVAASRLRLREQGRYLTGTIHVVPREADVSPDRLERLEEELMALHWRVHDVSIMPRSRLGPPEGDGGSAIPYRSPLRPAAVRRGED